MDSVLLYQEFRLVERNENEVSVVWKGAHLILFFLTFVFGSFCTFFFHVLMYMFDQKCVLFPELVPHSSLRKIVYEFFTINADDIDFPNNENVNELPVDFMSTQWVEDSVCYLPTYVPLVSGLCGLIWTTMFLMCSSGASSPAGMQRQWRALPLIFVFSLAMGSLCTYASTITNNGLEDLCYKLGRLTGSNSCTYTINVATLGYERRIRGVYQATRLTIATAWLHTSCWLLSAILTLVRILLAIDFQLVSVKVQLLGDIDRMMEKYERHVRCVSPDSTGLTEDRLSAVEDVKSIFSDTLAPESGTPPQKHVEIRPDTEKEGKENAKHVFYVNPVDAIFVSEFSEPPSMNSLVEVERHKLYDKAVWSEHQFIVRLLYDCLEDLQLPNSKEILNEHIVEDTQAIKVHRQQGLANIFTTPIGSSQLLNVHGTGEVNRTVGQHVHELIDTFTSNIISPEERSDIKVTEQKSKDHHKKSNLKTKGAHTSRKVHISSVINLEKPEEGKPEIKSEEENKDGQGTSEDAQDTSKGVHTSRKVHISSVVNLEKPEEGKPEIKSEEENKDGQGTSEDAQDTSKGVHTSPKVHTTSVVKLEKREEGKPEIKSKEANKDGQGTSEDAQDPVKGIHTSRKVHTSSVVKLEEPEEGKPEIKSEEENKDGQGTSEDAQDTSKRVHTSRKVHTSSVVKLEEPEEGTPEIKIKDENKDGQGTSEDAQDTSKGVHTSRKVPISSVVKLEEPEEGKPEIKSEEGNKDRQGTSEDAQDTSKGVHTSRKVHTSSVVKLEQPEEGKTEIKSEIENKHVQGTSEDVQDTSKGVHTSRKVHTSSVVKLEEPEDGKPGIKSEEENKDGQGTSEDAQDTSNASEKKAQTPEEKQN